MLAGNKLKICVGAGFEISMTLGKLKESLVKIGTTLPEGVHGLRDTHY